MADPRNRRSDQRLDVVLKVDYDTADDFLADLALNASSGGVFIATNKPVEIGDEVDFRISFPGLLSPIACRGEVRWRRDPEQATQESPAGFGVAFVFEGEPESTQFRKVIEPLVDEQAYLDQLADKPYRLLLACDNNQLLSVVLSALRAFNNQAKAGQRAIDVVDARDVIKAWQLIREHRDGPAFDMAVIDLGLGGDRGSSLIQRIKESDSSKPMSLPVLAIGDDRDSGARQAAYLAGADQYLPQPVRMSELFRSLHRFLFPELLDQD